MNIKEAKEQIKYALMAYFSKNEYGNYKIPLEKQRPIFLLGAPGIGKTAIMEQIAQELNVGLVSYSMTHHTRQSALGLPKILKKTYQEEEFEVSRYTMSEIISSIYELMEKTGVKEGILFLDEINCVSETLAPSMLLFLQYKIFGGHQIPDGWTIVTAGNPPEYNKFVREFDVVTMDRLKKITVEPDYSVWKEYAYHQNIHPVVMTYLDIKKDCFYHMESSIDGKRFVTPRGWEDLSQMIQLFEELALPVDEKLIAQYLQDGKIAKDFATYYDLFSKYQSDYQIEEILSGNISDEIRMRAGKARFDEKVALLGLFLDKMAGETKELLNTQKMLLKLLAILKEVKTGGITGLEKRISGLEKLLQTGRQAKTLSENDFQISSELSSILGCYKTMLESGDSFDVLKENFNDRLKSLKSAASQIGEHFTHLFEFYETTYANGQEILLLVTELTVNEYTSAFISQYGCVKYFEHNQELLFHERNKEIIERLNLLEFETSNII